MFRQIFSRQMIVTLLMGFSSGIPLLLIGGTLKAWLKNADVDLALIGVFSIVGLPYTLKFLWAPFFDRVTLPFLGRRRGWLLVTQVCLMISIFLLSFVKPEESVSMLGFAALLVSFCGASQDILVDAYRRETLSNEELGWGSAMYVNGYRIAMLLTGAGALIIADQIPWDMVYKLMALSVLVGILTTLFCSEPKVNAPPVRTIRAAFIEPLLEFAKRKGALSILVFILLYKLGDSLASELTNPFYLDLGFTKTQIGSIAKVFGFWSTIAGSMIGGLIILRIGIYRALWIFGILQGVTILGFSWLAHIGTSEAWLAAVITAETGTAGMGTSAYMAYMASQTNKRFTATQYALMSSLMGVPRVILATPTGWLAEKVGWDYFFLICSLISIPGLMMLAYIQKAEGKA